MSDDSIRRRLLEIGNELKRLGDEAVFEAGEDEVDYVPASAELPEVDLAQVRAILRARRMREEIFGNEIFADPAWDILLSLLTAELGSQPMPAHALCKASAVADTTALRWIALLVGKGLLTRRNDPHDGRRIFIAMTPETSQTLRRYLASVAVKPL